jgi:hypothetical protein
MNDHFISLIITCSKFIPLLKNTLHHLIITCNLKVGCCTRQGFIKIHFTCFHNPVSFKVKSTISTTMCSITKKNVVGRMRLKFIQIALFQNKTLASKRPQVTHFGRATMHKLIRRFLQDSMQESPVRNIASCVYRFGLIFPRSLVLIEHHPSHLHTCVPQHHSEGEHREKKTDV